MPFLPLLARTGLINKRRGSKVHTSTSEVQAPFASSSGVGPAQQFSQTLQNHLVRSGDLVIPRGSPNYLKHQRGLRRRWSDSAQPLARATGTLSLKRKRSPSCARISDHHLTRPLKRMRILEGQPLPWAHGIWEARSLLRRQDSEQGSQSWRRREDCFSNANNQQFSI
ncbi:hypothetical protein WJX84_009715 [Apatococcus fuscideae]|uniref:Uncharacterized protein n=1 Tax=Apatococcus fuscideae TaxID=2026836 RepID=A0AAW1T5H0_9CHLO